MGTITLEKIEKKHSEIAAMIAEFKAQSITEFVFPETQIELRHGEHYAGLIIGKDGESSYHLILLPGEAESVNWQAAKDWATSIDGELPTRREQSLLYANLKEEFKESWYWSGEQHASDSGDAWCQTFGDGGQSYGSKSSNFRARAVRRLVIK